MNNVKNRVRTQVRRKATDLVWCQVSILARDSVYDQVRLEVWDRVREPIGQWVL